MAGLPRKYAKMGFKRGWRAFKSSRGSKRKTSSYRKVTTTRRRSYKMAKKKSYRRAKGIFGNLNKPLMGAVGVVAYESLISPMIPLQGVAKDLLELGVGAYLSKKQGFLGATGKSLVVLNSYQLMSGLVGNQLKGLMPQTNNGIYNYGGEF